MNTEGSGKEAVARSQGDRARSQGDRASSQAYLETCRRARDSIEFSSKWPNRAKLHSRRYREEDLE